MVRNEQETNGASGMGFASVLTLIFIVLKLVGVITWSWVWVLSPIWIGFIIIAVILLAIAIFTHFLTR